ncbi:hypothetical protein MMC09_001000 [Bachmanniomyces sp. S44760]|nr:hypothetical protein [Bachmanniomyces sp. S44760]
MKTSYVLAAASLLFPTVFCKVVDHSAGIITEIKDLESVKLDPKQEVNIKKLMHPSPEIIKNVQVGFANAKSLPADIQQSLTPEEAQNFVDSHLKMKKDIHFEKSINTGGPVTIYYVEFDLGNDIVVRFYSNLDTQPAKELEQVFEAGYATLGAAKDEAAKDGVAIRGGYVTKKDESHPGENGQNSHLKPDAFLAICIVPKKSSEIEKSNFCQGQTDLHKDLSPGHSNNHKARSYGAMPMDGGFGSPIYAGMEKRDAPPSSTTHIPISTLDASAASALQAMASKEPMKIKSVIDSVVHVAFSKAAAQASGATDATATTGASSATASATNSPHQKRAKAGDILSDVLTGISSVAQAVESFPFFKRDVPGLSEFDKNDIAARMLGMSQGQTHQKRGEATDICNEFSLLDSFPLIGPLVGGGCSIAESITQG